MKAEKDATLQEFSNTLKSTFEGRNKQAEDVLNNISSKFEDALNKSTIKDQKLLKLIEESANSEGTYKKRVDELLKNYTKASSKTEQKKADKLLSIVQAKENAKEQLKVFNRQKESINPLKAFSQAFEDFKKSNTKKEGLRAGASTLGKGLKSSVKENIKNASFKNISKILLHSAGIAMDLPALNILASEIKMDVAQRQTDNKKSIELSESLDNLSTTEKGSSISSKKKGILSNNKNSLIFEKQETSELQEFLNKMGDLTKISEDMYTDFGVVLEDIKKINNDMLNSNISQQAYLKQFIDIQKNKLDNNLATADKRRANVQEPKNDKKKKDDNSGFNSKFLNKGLFKNVLPIIATAIPAIAEIALPLLLPLVAAYLISHATGMDLKSAKKRRDKLDATVEKKKETHTQNVQNRNARIADFRSLKKNTKQYDDNVGGGKIDNQKEFTNSLDKSNVIDLTWFGHDEIKNWKAVEALSANQIIALKNNGSWSYKDYKKLRSLYEKKAKGSDIKTKDIKKLTPEEVKNKAGVTGVTGVKVKPKNVEPNLSINSKPQNISVLEQTKRATVTSNENYITKTPQIPQVITLPQQTTSKVSQYSLESNDLVLLMANAGIRL